MNGREPLNEPLLDNDNPELSKKVLNKSSSSSSSGSYIPTSEELNKSSQIKELDLTRTADPINHIAITKALFDNWRLYRLLYSVLAVAAIIPS